MFNQGVFSTFRPVFRVKKVIPIFNNFQKNLNLSRCSRFRKWVSTTAAEMKRYLALIFAMGLVSQSDINEYWSTDPVTSTPFFPATMSRDHFLLITSGSVIIITIKVTALFKEASHKIHHQVICCSIHTRTSGRLSSIGFEFRDITIC
jgi:hypothetical protein